jgi:hypothetical protein
LAKKLIDANKGNEAAAALLKDMEATAALMRKLIVSLPPHDLLGYIYSQYILKAIVEQSAAEAKREANGPDDLIDQNQFLLEYVHAVLASTASPEQMKFDEAQCAELFELSRKLREQAMFYAMASSADIKGGQFGPDTAEIEFRAKSNWVLLRGNRYQVLEGEFYSYVLAPHDDVLREVYGYGAADIAEGFQAMANVSRSGHADAIGEIMKQFKAAQAFAATCDKPLEDIMETWVAANAGKSKAAGLAFDDMFRGGTANVSRHTMLPPTLLADLAYRRGEETEFFAVGEFAGTPYRTLPARKKPLIQLGSDYYAIDPCFTRDAGYRALLYNLLKRMPDSKKTFEERQKSMSESAFADILSNQLPRATVFQEVYYKDPASKQWVENDTLILIDDVLFLVEAKAGAAATIASPALDFGRHAQSVKELVVKAYIQCERFFNYLNSAEEVPLYHRMDREYKECGRVRRTDYRLMIPIGLTVESFSPFSTYCKELPQIEPILGKHAFISMSIDDLFVLKRFLPSPGMFVHYMEVRQSVAGIRKAHLFDEFDHLGAYLTKNRFDHEIADQMKDGKTNMLIWDGMSDIVDKSFEGEDWEGKPFPTQEFPELVQKLLEAIDATRTRGWLSAESHIRNLGEEGRTNLAKVLSELLPTLKQHPSRYFTLAGEDEPLFVWLQRHDQKIEWTSIKEKASAAAVATNAANVIGIVALVKADGSFFAAYAFAACRPPAPVAANCRIYDDASRMTKPARMVHLSETKTPTLAVKAQKLGRNDPCPCGSGAKFKKCHGR